LWGSGVRNPSSSVSWLPVIETEDALVYDSWTRYLGSSITGLLEEIGA
jgi:hypothetical protein